MTRDEIIEYYTHLLERREKNSQIVDDSFVKDSLTDLFESVLRELKQPQPDTETGLMPCGCGRKVKVEKYPGFSGTSDLYQVDCFGCHVGTHPAMSPEMARDRWNRSKGIERSRK